MERNVHDALPPGDRADFLATHKTGDKLNYALGRGIDLPDQYFLLAVIYNEAVHLRANSDHMTPLFSKLENLTIRHMISESVKALGVA